MCVCGTERQRQEQGRAPVPTVVFLLGYALVWTAYGAVAALAQWRLHEADLLSATMASTSTRVGGALLLVAGVFEHHGTHILSPAPR